MLSLDKRLELWEKTLEPDKVVLIAYAIKKEVTKLDELINTTLDNCYGAAIGDYTNLSIKEIKQIIKKAYEYMEESKEFINESGMDWMNKIEKVEENVKQFLRKEMTAGTLKSKAMCKAKKEFGIPAKDISNLWMIVKEEEHPELCENPRGLVGAKLKAEEEEETKNKPKSEEKEVKGKTIQEDKKKGSKKAIDKQNKEIKSSLVEVTQVREFIGKFGSYQKLQGGTVKAGILEFKNANDVEDCKKQIDEKLEEERKEFEKKISEKRIKALGRLNEVIELLSM